MAFLVPEKQLPTFIYFLDINYYEVEAGKEKKKSKI